VKTRYTGKGLVGAVVVYKLYRLAMELQLHVAPRCVDKWSVNPASNPKPRRESHCIPRDIILQFISKFPQMFSSGQVSIPEFLSISYNSIFGYMLM
jgi:hypothetical protein